MSVCRRCDSCDSMTWAASWPTVCGTCGGEFGVKSDPRKTPHVVVRNWERFHNGINQRITSKRDLLNKAGQSGLKVQFDGV